MSQSTTDPAPAAKFRLWGPASGLGLATAVLAFALDQAHKYWMLEVYRIGERGRVEIAPFFDLVMAWNKGVSYGLFAQHNTTGWLILIALSVAAVIGLLMWIANAGGRLPAIALGMIVGGALGNLTDRVVHGAVADFFHFHYAGFSWYVFNIADVAICAGVAGLLLDWLFSSRSAPAD
jgi:signal peptidase II